MSATCFVFAFQQWRLNVGERTDDEPFRWVFNIRLCLFGPLDGACYAGLGLMLLCRLRGIPTFPQQPGHWFLIVRGIALLINDSVDLAMYVGQQHDDDEFPFTLAVAILLAEAIPAAVAAIQVGRNAWWRAAYFLIVTHFAVILIHTALVYLTRGNPWFLSVFAWGSSIVSLLPAVCAAIATIQDRREGKRRDFLHWTGTTVMLLYSVIAWPVSLWS